MRTYRGFQWELGKWYKKTEEEILCSPDWLHFYSDPLVGLFLNPIHADIKNPRLFRVEVKGKGLDDNETKYGYSHVRLIEELLVPQISPVQRVRFAILCAKKVYKGKEWNEWANKWLSKKNRINVDRSNKYNFCTTRTMGVSGAVESAYFATKSATSTVKSKMIAFYAAKSADLAAEIAFCVTKNKKINLIRIARKAMEK